MDLKIYVAIPEGNIRDTFFPPEVVKKMESIARVAWNDTGGQLFGEELRMRIQETDVCMTGWNGSRYERDVLEGTERLKIIAHTGGSVAGLVSDYVYDKGITVLSGNALYAESVAEGVIAYMLCALRKIPYFHNEMQQSRWTRADAFYNEGLLDQDIGLVGFGAIARFLVKMLAPFKVKIKAYDPYVGDDIFIAYGVERASLEDVFSKSKIISLHAASIPSTCHMIGRELLQTIPGDALLVNTARAGIIDTDALEEELQKNRFKAVLDVFDIEPLPSGSKLLGLPNVILLPHMAGPTIDRRKLVTLSLIDDVIRIYEGKEPLHAIDRKYARSMTAAGTVK